MIPIKKKVASLCCVAMLAVPSLCLANPLNFNESQTHHVAHFAASYVAADIFQHAGMKQNQAEWSALALGAAKELHDDHWGAHDFLCDFAGVALHHFTHVGGKF